MTSKEYNKMQADVRRSVARKYGFRQCSYINYKTERGYFFCLDCIDPVYLEVKPMYADDLWWDIFETPGNKNEPLSLRGEGAFAVDAQPLCGGFDRPQSSDRDELERMYDRMFQDVSKEISDFLAENPDADKFYPDEQMMSRRPHNLLYVLALVHNGRYAEAIETAKAGLKTGHGCGMSRWTKKGDIDGYDFVIEWCLRKLKQDSKHNYLQMKLNNLFKRFKGTGLNEQEVPANDHDDFEIIISSDDPYRTRTSVNGGLEETATFAESWEVQTEAMEKSTKVPVRLLYDEQNLYRLDLYLPDATTNREMRERGQSLIANLWLFFDDDEFIIIFPELIDLYMDSEQTITHYRLNLGKTGFHSELKRLGDKYSHKEICDMVCRKLSESDIVEIEPKIIEDETYDCHPVTVSTHTARTLKKAFKAIRNAL